LLLITGRGVAGLVDSTVTRHLFFTGKGGVGKTSTACASAVGLAHRGRSVLLVSTDPASNLEEVLGQHVGTTPTPVDPVPGLSALNVDPEAAAAAYRERVIGPYRGALPDSAVARVEEQLSGACTVEIAAFDEFTALLTDAAMTARFDHIVFDTAPTGHTLRLLALPSAWSTFIGDGTGTSCLGPLSGMVAQQARYAQAVAVLSDPASTTLVLVARPEEASLAEAQRASTELRALGIGQQRLVVNGLFTATAGTAGTDDPLAVALEAQGRHALATMPSELAGLPRDTVRLRSISPVGIHQLRRMAEDADTATGATTASPTTASPTIGNSATASPTIRNSSTGSPTARNSSTAPATTGSSSTAPATTGSSTPEREPAPVDAESFHGLIDTIAAGGAGLVMTMGKGGVGKTTVAAAVAVALAERGHRVHLTTTDPAAHLADALGNGAVDGLEVARIDPVAETVAYTADVLATAGADLDDGARSVLMEDLASPCTEEIAVFQAFARTVALAQDAFVVLDTAPTGHTLLLLDAARTYHRELARQSGQMPEHVLHLLDRLRDTTRTHVLLVAVPEATPVHEAARLQADLARTGITPRAWVLNQSIAAAFCTDPLLVARAAAEHRHLTEVATTLAERLVVLPRVAAAPIGAARLQALVGADVSVTV
jgi:arsenite-transporting ATPase